MRNLVIVSILSMSSIPLAAADPAPTTSACLGDIHALACPAGATQRDTECRARGGHWSGSTRQGPSVFVRSNGSVTFAANYKDHKKQGRTFSFTADGKLEGWSDMADDDYHGTSVNCRPDGTVSQLMYFDHGKAVGLSRAWREDGTLSYAFGHDAAGHSQPVTASAAEARRPDELCRPVRCDVTTAPDLSGIPRK